mgnify:CR=1 FL=1
MANGLGVGASAQHPGSFGTTIEKQIDHTQLRYKTMNRGENLGVGCNLPFLPAKKTGDVLPPVIRAPGHFPERVGYPELYLNFQDAG